MERYALKYDEEFLVADALGDITGDGDGLFHNDTRLLSRFSLSVGGAAPSLLSSGVSQDNVFFRANVTNRPLPQLGGSTTPEGVIHVERTRLLWDRRLYERITLTNYGEHEVPAPLRFAFASDFADIFEVRGHVRRRAAGCCRRARRRRRHPRLRRPGRRGAHVRRRLLAASRPPRARFGRIHAGASAPCEPPRSISKIGAGAPSTPDARRFRQAAAQARMAMRRKRRRGAALHCPRGPFQTWLQKSRADLALLTTELPTGPYPYAGIPWFSTPFGRDGIITALELLWLDASLARGVLQFLAESQAHGIIGVRRRRAGQDPARDAPGRARRDSRSAFRSLLRRRRHDAAVRHAGRRLRQANRRPRVRRPAVAVARGRNGVDRRRLRDSNGDGFVDYARANAIGLVNQGWKDSTDSIFHADGTMAKPPIALVEVQGYVYAARRAMAWLAERRGDLDRAQAWRRRAKALRAAVEKRFWLPGPRLLRDRDRRHGTAVPRARVESRTSALHRACHRRSGRARVIEQLLSAAFNNGWGLRTLASDQPRFNPMSYHNGSVWPHDTAICAAGIAAYGHRNAAAKLLSDRSTRRCISSMRLPELYCGFVRRTGEPPVGYPVACLPQAWSSGAAFMMLQACLGITIDGLAGVLRIDRPELPREMEYLSLRGVAVGNAHVNVAFERFGDRVDGGADRRGAALGRNHRARLVLLC